MLVGARLASPRIKRCISHLLSLSGFQESGELVARRGLVNALRHDEGQEPALAARQPLHEFGERHGVLGLTWGRRRGVAAQGEDPRGAGFGPTAPMELAVAVAIDHGQLT